MHEVIHRATLKKVYNKNMCYFGTKFPKGIKKDQGHFNLMSDLHTLLRDAQQNLFYGEGGKKDLVDHLSRLIANVKRGEYDSVASLVSEVQIDKCTPEMSVDREV